MAHQASVVLTTNGEPPAAALVAFATLEAMRGALLHLLLRALEVSFAQMQAQVASEPHAAPTSDPELDALVGEAVRRVRSQPMSPHDGAQP